MRALHLAVLACAVAGLAVAALAPVAAGGSPRVTLSGDDVLVDGKPLGIVKCVSYQPAPPGANPARGYAWAASPSNYREDLRLLDRLGANVVSVNTRAADEPHELRTFMSRALDRGIRTILVVNGPNFEDPREATVQAAFLGDVARAVDAYKDHDGLLMWQLGIEVDWSHRGSSSKVEAWYDLLDRGAALVRDRDGKHPVLTANNPATPLSEFEEGSPRVHAYGVNDYAVTSGMMESRLERLSRELGGRPVLVTEFGADAYDSDTRREDGGAQARALADAWRGIHAARSGGANVLGGCVHEWTDQWWKHGSASGHDTSSWRAPQAGVMPDDAFSEEWFGITRNTAPREPREAFYRLADAWGGFDHAPERDAEPPPPAPPAPAPPESSRPRPRAAPSSPPPTVEPHVPSPSTEPSPSPSSTPTPSPVPAVPGPSPAPGPAVHPAPDSDEPDEAGRTEVPVPGAAAAVLAGVAAAWSRLRRGRGRG